MTRGLGLLWLTGLALVPLLTACGGSSSDAPAAGAPVADPRSQQTIGATGGQIISPDGRLTLQVPAGALAQSITITVTEVAEANRSEVVRAQRPARVYRLEPDGLAFAQPATATVDMPPSAAGGLLFPLLHSGGQFEALPDPTLSVDASRRRITAQIAHFSELLVMEESGVTVTASVAPRSIKVNETLDATLSVAKEGSAPQVTVVAEIDYISTSHAADLVFVIENLTDFFTASPPVTLAEGATVSKASLQTWKCLREHTGSMRFRVRLTMPYPIVDTMGNRIDTTTITYSRLEPAQIDYVCDAATPPPGGLRTGVFLLPFGMSAPDGVHLIDGAFANLGGTGPFLSVAGSNGAVIIDLRTGLSALNMTPSGPDGRLGNGALLGALPVSLPSPGPATVAGLFATSTGGGAIRSYTERSGGGFIWGATLLRTSAELDATPAGGRYVTSEVVTAGPSSGINFWAVPPASPFWQFSSRIDPGWFQGSLVSATVPAAGSTVLALTTGTSGSTTSTVWAHDRTLTVAKPLFQVPGASGRRLRCLDGLIPATATTGPRALCGVTEAGGTVAFFTFDPASPTATLTPVPVTAGAGALGLDMRRRAAGTPAAVVANFGDTKLNVIDFDNGGAVTANRTVDLPPGCTGVPHAVLVSSAGSDYVFGSCNGSAAWFGLRLSF